MNLNQPKVADHDPTVDGESTGSRNFRMRSVWITGRAELIGFNPARCLQEQRGVEAHDLYGVEHAPAADTADEEL